MASIVGTGTLSAIGPGEAVRISGVFNVSITTASTVAQLGIERSFDNGSTWLPLSVLPPTGNQPVAIQLGVPGSIVLTEPEGGTLYRVVARADLGSTTVATPITWRISQ